MFGVYQQLFRGDTLLMIQIKCKGTHNVKLDDLVILQETENFCLKELTEKNFNRLKTSLKKYGFLFPFFGWFSEEEKKWYVTDGTQRLKVLLKMTEAGEKLPENFPLIQIFADNKKEAARAILLQSSRYGKITQEGFDGFIDSFDLSSDWLECVEFPEVLTWDIPTENKEDNLHIGTDDKKDYQIIIYCDDEIHQQNIYDELSKQFKKIEKK